MKAKRWTWGRVGKWLAYTLLAVLVGLPVVFALVFLGIQEATERQ